MMLAEVEAKKFYQPPMVRCRFVVGSMTRPARRGLHAVRRAEVLRARPPAEAAPARRLAEPRRWLEDVYRLCAEGKIEPALDLVLDELDELLHERNAAQCDAILAEANVERIPVEVQLAFLMETARAQAALPARAGFYRRVEAKLLAEHPQRARALLANLE